MEFRECNYPQTYRTDPIRLHNMGMNGQVIAIRSYRGLIVSQEDKDDPTEEPPIKMQATPPPLVRMSAPAPDEQAEADELAILEAEEQTKKLQPAFVNRAYVKMESRTLRISFGERVADEDIYRSAIVMTPEDAYQLGALLMQQARAAYGAVLEHYRQVLEGLEDDEGPVDG